ncbi:hypothetical protein R1sor_004994 [Riccia sorocarpa]|uniref:DDE Tnp4 domain-containing protein n=1 Tax=Riccia sorocarpa TaxID=122646 RepID=A0ABD3HIT8_9MARC
MEKRTFRILLSRLQSHPIFHNESNHSQTPVEIQLAVGLDRMGHEGNGACIARSMELWGVSHGTLVNFTKRVMTAIEDLLAGELKWPSPRERQVISEAFAEKGFPGCIGLIDGTLVELIQRPRFDGETYYDRKANYSVNAQVREESVIFGREEYLLGDSGYIPMPHLVPAFKLSGTDREKSDFNNCIAHARVVNEHCIGVLKSRWHSLKRVRTQLKCMEENKIVVKWIKDDWTIDDAPVEYDPAPNQNPADSGIRVEQRGVSTRDRVMRIALRTCRQPGGILNRQRRFERYAL